ncbi:DNA alkylation repair protein [Lysinibacillus contaminans]|uniref:DNA alkylation repair protein n=1 Tax=Lysinibacillus contaminans TaxID=1293441 RepID=A0ABR5K0V7_9BACI|nr:DNA alkylation repair protein [Lysinibacillus contaminans]KOS68542.1 DNA alkylation repair protein [Lysinibacillus contaminans]
MVINEAILNRKGARKAIDIPNNVLALLNQGRLETVNLIEWQAVNHPILLKNILPSFGLDDKLNFVLSEMEKQNAETGMKAIRTASHLLDNVLENESKGRKLDIITLCANHISDSVRCWAAFMNKNANLALEEKLSYIQPFAADHHFGVREIAWMSIRENLSEDIEKSVELLVEWASSPNENIRRFAVESIRPRGVWTKHIELLKQEPEKALPILNLLKADPAKYVQDSVGNWLNDASKTQPEWVLDLCEKWANESDLQATGKIIKKAKRTILKKG